MSKFGSLADTSLSMMCHEDAARKKSSAAPKAGKLGLIRNDVSAMAGKRETFTAPRLGLRPNLISARVPER